MTMMNERCVPSGTPVHGTVRCTGTILTPLPLSERVLPAVRTPSPTIPKAEGHEARRSKQRTQRWVTTRGWKASRRNRPPNTVKGRKASLTQHDQHLLLNANITKSNGPRFGNDYDVVSQDDPDTINDNMNTNNYNTES